MKFSAKKFSTKFIALLMMVCMCFGMFGTNTLTADAASDTVTCADSVTYAPSYMDPAPYKTNSKATPGAPEVSVSASKGSKVIAIDFAATTFHKNSTNRKLTVTVKVNGTTILQAKNMSPTLVGLMVANSAKLQKGDVVKATVKASCTYKGSTYTCSNIVTYKVTK